VLSTWQTGIRPGPPKGPLVAVRKPTHSEWALRSVDRMNDRRPRHYHYASADHPEMLDGLWNTAADAVFIDLEDGVGDEHKGRARQNARRFLEANDRADKRTIVRINAVGGPHWRADVELCAPLVDRLMVPLLERPDPLGELDEALSRTEAQNDMATGSCRLHLLVETAGAVVNLDALVTTTTRVEGLFFGQADFLLSVGSSGIGDGRFRPGPVAEWTHPIILLHARARGLETATTVWAPAGDEDVQVAEMRRLYEMGYDAVVVGSAAGVTRADQARAPAPGDLAFAREVRKAYDAAAGSGAPASHQGWAIEGAMARVADRTISRASDA
jgi:citrate lyase beta subunit